METHNRDQLDDLLDGALKRYGEVEPRAGLEARVLANLAAARISNTRARWTWACALSGTTACVLVSGIWLAYRGQIKPAITASKSPVQDVTAPPPVAPIRQQLSRREEPRPPRTPHPHVVTVAKEPKLRKFPSPRPMSEQELLLIEYTHNFPQEAILVAKEQDEFQKRIDQAEREIGSGSSSDRQEK